MDADAWIDQARTVTMVVASDGTIRAARGGFGGFLGLDIDAAVGTNVFDRLTPEAADELAVYFLENAGESAETIALPVPFRLPVVDDEGNTHLVDVIATGRKHSPDDWDWVVVLVPVSLTASMSRSLELEMSGADRAAVKRMLCEELASDNALYTTRTMLVELDTGGEPSSVVVARDVDRDHADRMLAALRDGWCPWQGLEPRTVGSILRDQVPDDVLTLLDERGERRFLVAPVVVDGRRRAVIMLLSRVPASYPIDVVKHNVERRMVSLADATALLIERWSEQDRLLGEATSDPLTGVGNARRLTDALADAHDDCVLLFIDIDHFKQVNDTFGHLVGDEVLKIVASRILESCRERDLVTRVGGDEFVVLLDRADADLGAEIGRRLLDTVSAPLRVGDGPHRISVSVGIATMHHEDPLEAADRAMLRAKQAGRGRLEHAEPPG